MEPVDHDARCLFAPVSVDPATDLGEVLPVLPGVLPPARDLGCVEPMRVRVVTVHVGDLELSARRRREPGDHVEDVRRVAVEAHDGV